MHDLTHTTNERILASVLHAEVDDLTPCDCLDKILAAAHARTPLWPWLLAALAVLLIAAGLAMAAATQQHQPARIPAHVTRLMEP